MFLKTETIYDSTQQICAHDGQLVCQQNILAETRVGDTDTDKKKK